MITLKEDILHVTLMEELTIYQVEELHEQLKVSLSSLFKTLHIDLSNVDKIDTAGFQLLVSLKKNCEVLNASFEIGGMTTPVQNFMLLFGFDWDTEYKGTL